MAKRPKVHPLRAESYTLGLKSVPLSLRLEEDLRQQLARAAEAHRISLSREIHLRLKDSFARETTRTLEKLIIDMETIWARFNARFLRLDLETALAEKLAACRELPPDIASLARLWIAHRAQEQQPSSVGALK
jgi:Arc-like DNA binding dprotein